MGVKKSCGSMNNFRGKFGCEFVSSIGNTVRARCRMFSLENRLTGVGNVNGVGELCIDFVVVVDVVEPVNGFSR